jgi:hypothetical protein
MMNRSSFVLAIFAILIIVGLSPVALGQDTNLANVTGGGSSVRFDVTAPNGGVTLTVTAPDGRTFSREYRAGTSPEFTLSDKTLVDGVYAYELRLRPTLTAGQREALKASRGNDDDPESERAARKRTTAGAVQSGSFAVVNGQIIVAGLKEDEGGRAKADAQPGRLQPASTARVFSSGNTAARLRNHRASLLSNPMFDFVVADDLIVQGSACVGLDCVDGESFSFDTIRTKENNVRISFNDTSTSAGFPTEDWTIRANSSASGGGNFLAFVDRGTNNSGDETGTIVFEVDAGAPANSLRVSSAGKIGVRTATPVLDVHVNTTDTPAMRFEQNNSGGFTAQTWDVAGNEANFFVRDVTSGSRLPFRIRPGAPTSSIDIAANGNVGIGTASPAALLNVVAPSAASGAITNFDSAFASGGFSAFFDTVGARTLRGLVGFGPTLFGSGDNSLFGVRSQGALTFAINAGVRQMTIDTTGNVGIGTTAPTQLLSVNGTAGKPGGGTWDVFSDERLKNIKGRYNTGLKALMQLQPLRYEYKKDNPLGIKSPGEFVGFGAQEVQKVIPEAVTQDSTGYLMIKSDPILWTMLNAIKEQQKEIEQLKSEIQKLRSTSHRRRK